jgi:serine protease Do
VGFAVPINMAKNVMDKLIEKGKVVRGWLGVIIQDIDADKANVLGIKDQKGALIGDVIKDGPAEKAGIKVGDVIRELDNKEIGNSNELKSKIAEIEPGTNVTFSIVRDGEVKEVRVKIDEQPSGEVAAVVSEKSEGEGTIGIKVSEITPNIAYQLQIDSKETGVVITEVDQAGIGADAGLAVGDIIKKINKKDIKTVRDYNSVIKNLKKGDSALMLIKRGENSLFVSFRIPK